MNQASPATDWSNWFRARAWMIAMIVIAGALGWLVVDSLNKTEQAATVDLFDQYECREHELNRITIALASHGLDQYQLVGRHIRVPHSLRARYLQVLKEENALPRIGPCSEDASVATNPFMPRSQQRWIERTRKKREIRDLIMRLPFVEEAWFEMDSAPSTRLFEPARQSALVMVQPTNPEPLALDQIKTIRELVSGAVAGIAPADVVITDVHAGVAYPDPIDDRNKLQVDSVRWRIDRQRFYLNRIRRVLIDLPDLEIEIHVDAPSAREPTKQKVARTGKRAPGDTTVSEGKPGQPQPDARTANVSQPGSHHRPGNSSSTLPGAGANGVAMIHTAAPPASDAPPVPVRTVSHERVARLPSFTQPADDSQRRSTESYERVQVVIRVPRSTIQARLPSHRRSGRDDDLLFQREFARLKAELIQRTAAVLPQTPGVDDQPVAVLLKNEPRPLAADPGFWDQLKANLLRQWPLLAVVLIGAIAVASIRPRKSGLSEPVLVQRIPTEIDENEQLKSQLTALIDQDPDAAATVIKNWIQDAA